MLTYPILNLTLDGPRPFSGRLNALLLELDLEACQGLGELEDLGTWLESFQRGQGASDVVSASPHDTKLLLNDFEIKHVEERVGGNDEAQACNGTTLVRPVEYLKNRRNVGGDSGDSEDKGEDTNDQVDQACWDI